MAWSDLGISYANCGQIEAAIEALQTAVRLARSREIPHSECVAWSHLSLIQSQFAGDLLAGIGAAKQALKVSQRLDDAYLVMRNKANLAIYYAAQLDVEQAEKYLQAVTEAYPRLAPEMQSSEKVHILACIARIQWLQGKRLQAFALVGYSLVLQPPWSSMNGRLVLRGAIAELFTKPTRKLWAKWRQWQWGAHPAGQAPSPAAVEAAEVESETE